MEGLRLSWNDSSPIYFYGTLKVSDTSSACKRKFEKITLRNCYKKRVKLAPRKMTGETRQSCRTLRSQTLETREEIVQRKDCFTVRIPSFSVLGKSPRFPELGKTLVRLLVQQSRPSSMLKN
jgi:hypothetical protein